MRGDAPARRFIGPPSNARCFFLCVGDDLREGKPCKIRALSREGDASPLSHKVLARQAAAFRDGGAGEHPRWLLENYSICATKAFLLAIHRQSVAPLAFPTGADKPTARRLIRVRCADSGFDFAPTRPDFAVSASFHLNPASPRFAVLRGYFPAPFPFRSGRRRSCRIDLVRSAVWPPVRIHPRFCGSDLRR